MTTVKKITELEQQLLQAMLKSDVKTLDSLLADDLIFTDHTGQVIDKAADLEAHRSGKVSIEAIEPGEQKIRLYQETAIVSVLMNIKGKYLGQPFEGRNRYTRVWVRLNNSWKIVAAQASMLHS